MRYHAYKALLLILRFLVKIKRGFFWLWPKFCKLCAPVSILYKNTVGFWIFKIIFFFQKRMQKIRIPVGAGIIDLFGRRNVLQIFLFIISIIILFPHTKLRAKETVEMPGRKTLLFQLVGPGDQDFTLDEVSIDVSAPNKLNARSWTEGAAFPSQQTSPGLEPLAVLPQEIAGTGVGGTAIVKPNIISGESIPSIQSETDASLKRNKIETYVVLTGDTIGAIAEKFSISVETILWANNLTMRSYIRPGDKLKILPATGILHKVSKGETVSTIAKKYSIKQDEVIKINKLQNDGSDIIIGEELLIPGGKKTNPIINSSATRKYSALSNIAAPPPSASAPAGSGYLWPAAARKITQYYGWRHSGLDIAGNIGVPLYASRSGRVIKSQCGWNGGYGCYAILDHGGGVQTLYGHASRLYVSIGDYVNQGDTVALMGSTGRSTGPHLHFEVRVNGTRVNPLSYIR
jgi:murein DD-endopeptidase MepM/ murein hydrolase activator NlpD